MKMLVGPYKDRLYGNLPIPYQKYLLDNIKRIDVSASDGNLSLWLTQHQIRINRMIQIMPTKYRMEQMRLMEALCGLEFQPSGIKIDTGTTKGNTSPVGGTTIIPTNPFK
jgi:hypothetical protein